MAPIETYASFLKSLAEMMRVPEGGHTFRWGLKKIRRMAFGTGVVVAVMFAGMVLYEIFVDMGPRVYGNLHLLLIGMAGAVGLGVLVCLLVGGVLLIGRASTKTVISNDGVFIQRAPWHKNFVRWTEIQSVTPREFNGWRYLYLKTPVSALGEVGLSVEVDEPRELELAIARFAPPSNPLRVAVCGQKVA